MYTYLQVSSILQSFFVLKSGDGFYMHPSSLSRSAFLPVRGGRITCSHVVMQLGLMFGVEGRGGNVYIAMIGHLAFETIFEFHG